MARRDDSHSGCDIHCADRFLQVLEVISDNANGAIARADRSGEIRLLESPPIPCVRHGTAACPGLSASVFFPRDRRTYACFFDEPARIVFRGGNVVETGEVRVSGVRLSGTTELHLVTSAR